MLSKVKSEVKKQGFVIYVKYIYWNIQFRSISQAAELTLFLLSLLLWYSAQTENFAQQQQHLLTLTRQITDRSQDVHPRPRVASHPPSHNPFRLERLCWGKIKLLHHCRFRYRPHVPRLPKVQANAVSRKYMCSPLLAGPTEWKFSCANRDELGRWSELILYLLKIEMCSDFSFCNINCFNVWLLSISIILIHVMG